jgi:hypothetical protein
MNSLARSLEVVEDISNSSSKIIIVAIAGNHRDDVAIRASIRDTEEAMGVESTDLG